jgi:hypothetical protein
VPPRVIPPKPVALVGPKRGTGWLWGRKRNPDGTRLGLATLFRGRFFEGPELGWHPSGDLRMLD